MATTEDLATGNLQEQARRHLWMHFTPHGRLRRGARDPDHRPRRGLLRLRPARQPLPRRSLRAVLREHRPRPRRRSRRPAPTRRKSSASSRTGATRTRTRSSWRRGSPSSPPGTSTASSSRSGGSEAVESALKLVPPVPQADRQPGQDKVIARETAYHGTSLGALTATGHHRRCARPFEPLVPGGCHVPNTNTYRLPRRLEDLAETIRERIEFEGPETVAA